MKRSIGTQSYRTKRQAKNREQFRKGYEILQPLQNFSCEISILFDFCLSLLCFLPKLSLCNSFCFFQFGNLHCLVVYNAQTTPCKNNFSFSLENKIFREACRTSSHFFSCSFVFFSFLTSQSPSKDDFSKDGWLKPLPP